MSEPTKTLSFCEFYKLCCWLEELQPHELDGHTLSEVAQAASKIIGCEISHVEIESAAKCTGIDWKQPNRDARDELMVGFGDALKLLSERLDRYNENHRELILRVSGIENSVQSIATHATELRGDVERISASDVNHARGLEDIQSQLRAVDRNHEQQLAEIRARLNSLRADVDCQDAELLEQRSRLADVAPSRAWMDRR